MDVVMKALECVQREGRKQTARVAVVTDLLWAYDMRQPAQEESQQSEIQKLWEFVKCCWPSKKQQVLPIKNSDASPRSL